MKTISHHSKFFAAVVALFMSIALMITPTVGCGSDSDIDFPDTVFVHPPSDGGPPPTDASTGSGSSSGEMTSTTSSSGGGSGGQGGMGSGGEGAAGGMGGGGGMSPTSSSSSSSSSSGMPPVFSAWCSGGIQNTCSWTYTVIDNGDTVKISIELATQSGENCSKTVTVLPLPPDPNVELSDDIFISCGGANWHFSINRKTMIVYIFSGISAWTPTCN